MNVYDFDETIYDGDSTVDLVFYLFKNYPKTILNIPRTTLYGLLFALRIMPKQTFKEKLFHMFNYVDNMDSVLDEFTNSHLKKIKSWYKDIQREDDVVISASPYFLINAFCKKIGIKYVMASPVDIKTGMYDGLNCHGEEKVVRFRDAFGEKEIEKFYSDSYSDTPLARLAKEAYIVKGDNISKWEKW